MTLQDDKTPPAADLLESRLQGLEQSSSRLEKTLKAELKKLHNGLVRDQRRTELNLYHQLESFHWLTRKLKLAGRLPPTRGWAFSPDALLKVHDYITTHRPRLVVEFGSGVSTVVIADALRQNGIGKLISIEHLERFGAQTRDYLQGEHLLPWVDLRVGSLEPWQDHHLNDGSEQAVLWYPRRLLSDVAGAELVLVDGPPGSTCSHARYPALPALIDRLAPNAEVWMDDAAREEEKTICEEWASRYHFSLTTDALEKGLARLTR